MRALASERRHVIPAAYYADLMKRSLEGFGPGLAELRKARGLTQQELGERVGVSQRMMAYYEQEDAQPPGALLVELAKALEVTTDELLGVEPLREKVSAQQARIRKRLRQVEELPPADQRTILKLVDALVVSREVEEGSS
jgi:transcriptional regulator with XRE-family HTH domain